MEKVKVLEWLKIETGDGYGDGSGDGSGSGYNEGSGSVYGDGDGAGDGSGYGYSDGCGDGCGDGSGYGYGDGSGSGYGYIDGYGFDYSDGDGISNFNGQDVYCIDGVQTIITSIKMSLAKGFILNRDFTLTPCYVVKGNGYFAHGKTVESAQEALRAKIFENMDADEAIEKFLETFKLNTKYPGKEFFVWHHYLTGSCEMGRNAFVKDRGLSLDDEYTVEEFIKICEGAYGGEIIKKLKERYDL